MLTLTQAAGTYLSEILDREHSPERVAVRLVIENEGLSMALDNKRPGDDSFEHDGRMVLVLNPEVSQQLEDKTLDTRHTKDGEKLVLRGATGSA